MAAAAKPAQPVAIGRGMAATLDGNRLTVEIDLGSDLGPSSSGKSRLVASSGGGKPVAATGVTLNLTAYRK